MSLPIGELLRLSRAAQAGRRAGGQGGSEAGGACAAIPGRHFASGMATLMEVRAMIRARRPFGVTLSTVARDAWDFLRRTYEGGEGPELFIDSGAFSEQKIGEITHEGWLSRLDRVYQLASRAATAEVIYMVAPDRIADQAGTLRRLERYQPELSAIAKTGANVIVPLQRGALQPWQMADRVDQLLQGVDWIPGLPMTSKGGFTHEDARALLRHRRVPRVHLLGVGPCSPKLVGVAEVFQEESPKTSIQMDTCILRTREVTEPLKTDRARALEELSEGRRSSYAGAAPIADYTDTIAFVSEYTSALDRIEIAKAVGIVGADLWDFVRDPDQFVQGLSPNEEDSWLLYPPMEIALEQAYDRFAQELEAPWARSIILQQVVKSPDFRHPATFSIPTGRRRD
jgi:hypothetical protein